MLVSTEMVSGSILADRFDRRSAREQAVELGQVREVAVAVNPRGGCRRTAEHHFYLSISFGCF